MLEYLDSESERRPSSDSGWLEYVSSRTAAWREALGSEEPAVAEVMIDKEATAPATYYESVVERIV